MWPILQFVLVGLGAGVLGGIFGIGGGLVVVPALIFLAKMPPKTAVGTSLGALALPVSALGAINYWRTDQLDAKASLCIAAGIAVGAFVGSRLAQHIEGVWVQRGFAILLVVVAVRLWIGAGQKASPPANASATPEAKP